MRVLLIVLYMFIHFGTSAQNLKTHSSCKAQLKPTDKLGGISVKEIQRVWIGDTCGFLGERDSIAKLLVKEKVLLGLKENDIKFLLGEPTSSSLRNNNKRIVYGLRGFVKKNSTTGDCDFESFIKFLIIKFDNVSQKVYYIRISEE